MVAAPDCEFEFVNRSKDLILRRRNTGFAGGEI